MQLKGLFLRVIERREEKRKWKMEMEQNANVLRFSLVCGLKAMCLYCHSHLKENGTCGLHLFHEGTEHSCEIHIKNIWQNIYFLVTNITNFIINTGTTPSFLSGIILHI